MLSARGKDTSIPSENRVKGGTIVLDSEIICSYRDPGRIEPRRVPLSRALFSPARLTPWSPRFYARVSFKTLVWLVMTGGDRPSS